MHNIIRSTSSICVRAVFDIHRTDFYWTRDIVDTHFFFLSFRSKQTKTYFHLTQFAQMAMENWTGKYFWWSGMRNGMKWNELRIDKIRCLSIQVLIIVIDGVNRIYEANELFNIARTYHKKYDVSAFVIVDQA